MGFWDDAAVISAYTRATALEDGTLMDLTQFDPDTVRQQLQGAPLAATAAVGGILTRAATNPRHMNDWKGLIWDVLWMSRGARNRAVRQAQQNGYSGEALFQVIIAGAGRQRNYTLKIHIGMGDQGEPVWTLLLPGED